MARADVSGRGNGGGRNPARPSAPRADRGAGLLSPAGGHGAARPPDSEALVALRGDALESHDGGIAAADHPGRDGVERPPTRASLTPCAWCGAVTPNAKFCSVAHAAAARTGLPAPPARTPRKRIREGRSLREMPPDRLTTFPQGLRPETVSCPRCTGLLTREPAFLRCRLCGHVWRIQGGNYQLQRLYELGGS